MLKKYLNILLSLDIATVIYMPIILLLIEYHHIPQPIYNIWRYSFSFIFFWGGGIIWLWSSYLIKNQAKGMFNPLGKTLNLVRTGIYKYTRNPMVIGICAILLGEALYFDALYLFIWLAIVVVGALILVPKIEEPQLLERFGQRYMEYRADVRRWF